MRRTVWIASLVLAFACGGRPQGGTSARFSDTPTSFWDAPFPNPARQRDDGTLVVDDFPNRPDNPLVKDALRSLAVSPVGFSPTAAVYLPFDGPLDEGSFEANVVLVDIDPESSTRGRRYPALVSFQTERETYAPANVLAVLIEPGVAMAPGRWHAAYVAGEVRSGGEPLGVGETLWTALTEPSGGFVHLVDLLEDEDIDPKDLRAATVFRTADPFAEMDRLRAHVLERPAPVAMDVVTSTVHETFCVLEGRVTVPVFQDGTRPYRTEGGEIRFDGDRPATEYDETIRFAVTIPRAEMPEGGWPLLFYAAGEGGAYTQVVDRGTFAEQMTTPGRGPALDLAFGGIAAFGFEAPLVGPRHPAGHGDGTDFFNIENLRAFRDNTRQGAIDYTTMIRLAKSLELDGALCPGATAPAHRFDAAKFAFWGHSTGSTIGALVAGLEPDLGAVVLSGAGASWLYNLTIKTQPFDFTELVPRLLDYEDGDELELFDAIPNLAQTLWSSTENTSWAARSADRDVLLVEGVVDGYFPPPAVNALARALGASVMAPVVDESIESVVGDAISAPASANKGGRTIVVVQHEPPAGVDGHYVPFENDPPKRQIRCFLMSHFEKGVASVPAPDQDRFGPCD